MSTHRWLLTASALFVVLLTAGAATASAPVYHFHAGVSYRPPTYPSTGKGVAIDSAQWAAQSFHANASASLMHVAVWASTATFSVVVSADASAPQEFDPIVLVAVAAGFGALVVAFLLWRGGKIEEVFLVHWSGVLIVHLSKTIKTATDRDILAGMLTTIQQFAREAFVEWRGRDIRRIDVGNQKIFLSRGSYSYLAAVVRGRKPGALALRMARSVAEFEGTFEGKLEEWDGVLETLGGAEELLSEALFQGGFIRFSKWLVRIFWPRHSRQTPSFPAQLQNRRRARVSREAGLRRIAVRLKQRRELNELDENNQSMVATALEEVSEGRFSVCGFANIYLAMVHREASSQKNDAWWSAVLQLIRDVLQFWKWDPDSQAWVSERDESPHPRRSPADLRLLRPSSAQYSRQPILVAPPHTLDTLPPREDG